MTRGALIEFLLLVVGVGSLWAFIFIIGPAASRSHFGWKLTEIRDEIEDRFLLSGEYAHDEQIKAFHKLVQALIQHSAGFTVLNIALVERSFQKAGVKTAEPVRFDWRPYPPDVRQAMHDYEVRLTIATVRYLFRGSPAGWAASIVMFCKTGMTAIRRRRTTAAIEPLAAHPYTQRAVTEYEQAVEMDPGMLDRHRLVGVA